MSEQVPGQEIAPLSAVTVPAPLTITSSVAPTMMSKEPPMLKSKGSTTSVMVETAPGS